ncbi:MAG TPA: amino acid adenylation domain-containing protein [Longimicrobium sp.]|nr:amino acid adenylation domain-containing protein [Longimicrobium sp.]
MTSQDLTHDDDLLADAEGDTFAFPMSFAQQRLYFLDRLQPGAHTYNLPLAVEVAEALDPAVPERVVTDIARRHESLRTVFREVRGEAVQVVLPPAPVPLPVHDVTHLPGGERRQAALALADRLSAEPYDLARGPVFRPFLVKVSESATLLALDTHHIVNDATGLGILITEAKALYTAFAAGRPSPLPDPALQYADYAIWQREALEGEELGGQLDWWTARMEGASGVLELPTDRPRPPQPTGRGDSYAWTWPQALRGRVLELARSERATAMMTFLAALDALLARWTGAEDVVVGTPVTGRTLPETEEVLGFFVNTVALRVGVEGDPTFREVLRRVRDEVFGALAHQDLPFERLVEELRIERDPARTPLFQVMYVHQGDEHDIPDEPVAAEWVPYFAEVKQAKFDFTLVVRESPLVFSAAFDYAADLFDRETMAALARRLTAILEAVTEDPDLRLSQLPWLFPEERAAVVEAPNATAFDFGVETTAHGLFERQAAETPEAEAAVFAGERWTYGELNARANRVAHRLLALGVKAEDRVAVLSADPLWALAGILGAMKAGAAYVPLDAASPGDRLGQIVEDAGAAAVLARGGAAGRLPPSRVPALALDDASLADASDANPGVAVDPEQMAYVIYTSGSTGKPKGVMVPHAGVVNLALTFVRRHSFRAGQRILVIPPLTFDASVGDLFPAWACGAALVFHPAPAELTGTGLLAFCREAGVHVVDTAAALFSGWTDQLAAEGKTVDPSPLEMVMMGGEAVTVERAAKFATLTGARVTLVNHYGPTEASVCAALRLTVDGRESAALSGVIPVGTPVDNVRVYVVDRFFAPVGPGVPGELVIGGRGVARGYLGRPGLTAERFVPDPFAAEPGGRLYRTGDRVRWLADGTVEFVGRTDHQVKIRGFRIEPAEVESALLAHDGVREALVMAREDEPGRKRLVAYVAGAAGGAAPDGAALREHLKARLPDYMVPAAFVALDAFPLTPHGKVDRKALPAPAAGREPAAGEAPRNETEAKVAEIWAAVLGIDRVGVHDDFFELGGHSLLAMPVMTRVRETLGVEVPLRRLFETPTVAALAAAVEEIRAGGVRTDYFRAPDQALADAVLAADVRPEGPAVEPGGAPRNVFLTGATGFLGAYVLHGFLTRTQADVYCLVRAKDPEAAHARVVENLRKYLAWDPAWDARVVPVVGDLSEPRLGLSEAQLDGLAERVDLVFHNGGVVNFTWGYDRFRTANVQGTEWVLRLACRHRAKPVHFVSTLGVFLTPEWFGRTVSEDAAPVGERIPDGYTQSKWVAERLVWQAGERGLPVTVHRPARVSGDSRTGAANPDDYLSRLLLGIAQLGAAPDFPWGLDMAPIDYVAAAMVELALHAPAGRAWNFYNPSILLAPQIADILTAAGWPVEKTTWGAWVGRVHAVDARNALHPLAASFSVRDPDTVEPPAFASERLEAALAGTGIACPAADAALVRTYLEHFVRRGLLREAGTPVEQNA